MNFTSAYELLSLEFQEYESRNPVIRDDLYSRLRQDYDSDVPLVLKHDGVHFPVVGESAVPADTLLVPPEMTDWFDTEFGVRSTDSEIVMALKGSHAESILSVIPHV